MDFGNLNWLMGGNLRGGGFDQTYRVHSVAFIHRPELESGGKIILPASALDTLTRLHIEYPMLFELSNRSENRKMHSGVLEFVAGEGMCYMPFWMMQNLLLEEGALVNIKNVSLQRGRFVKFQPHTKNFLDIANPRAVLESTLRNFTCLTKGDVIVINYNKKNYYVTVLETKPADAISIVETDLDVDFAPPLDYVEPTPQPKQEPPPSTTSSIPTPAMSIPNNKGKAPEREEDNKNKFVPFGGSGNSLRPTGTSPVPMSRTPTSTSTSSSPSPSPSTSYDSKGKLVFGAPTPQKKKKESDDEDSGSDEEQAKPKFVPFGGKGYSLKG
eukprot:Phypoly_transcript_10838.p1 GENE.Phypoly_transcript_10838~~Phypoly_transcript_10838.p1  ORF type:complete len:327 (+),score=61.50 Phypoly_transcript_10838:61-1041(+)